MAPRASTSSAAESNGPAISHAPSDHASQRLQLFHHLLLVVEVRVEAAARDQLLMRAAGYDASLVEHDDAVDPQQRRAPVRGEQDRGPWPQAEQALEDSLLGAGI